MLTSGAATAIALFTLVVSTAIGGLTGFLACLVLRLPWNVRVAVLDVGLAAVASVATVLVYTAIATARGQGDSAVKWVLLAATVSVIVRHVIRFLHPAH